MFSILVSFAAAQAQSGNAQTGGPGTADSQTGAAAQSAPIVRAYPGRGLSGLSGRFRQQEQVVESQPVAGVWLRSLSNSAVKTVSSGPGRVEVSLERGKLNVNVHHPADHTEILVDLPGGQTSLLKNGLYTFNAETNTVRVLRGEAAAYPGKMDANAKGKAIKVKEDRQFSMVAGNTKTVEAYPYELAGDLLPAADRGDGGGSGYEGYAAYPYAYPYYGAARGYPYGYGFYPGYYGFGYPFGYGIGFGYYGGFGGYRGGFRR